jgi:hypothetical protein
VFALDGHSRAAQPTATVVASTAWEPVQYGGKGQPGTLIVSDLPLQGDSKQRSLQVNYAIRLVLDEGSGWGGRRQSRLAGLRRLRAVASSWSAGSKGRSTLRALREPVRGRPGGDRQRPRPQRRDRSGPLNLDPHGITGSFDILPSGNPITVAVTKKTFASFQVVEPSPALVKAARHG